MTPLAVPTRTLRRIAVAAAGLHRTKGFGRGAAAGLRVLEHLGYVQVDTISVVRRAHEHIVDARADAFASTHWNRLVARGEAFEYWAHAAAYLPMREYRFSLLRMKHYRDRHPYGFRVTPAARRAVLERIRAEGPLRARDFEDAARHEISGWGRYKDSKVALEQLWHEGTLSIVARDGFEKTYELTERALPAGVDLREPSIDELAAHLVERARRTLGVFSQPHVTRLRKEAGIRPAVTRAL
ncbi:MAG: crosslink repair DNA glycosylase YcaQ family protein, partial [Pseudomonadales bacterium]|nr:crosslink repair DNA glycosylase YcaQ family protein [Pseudomonadales bacterium]